MDQKAVLGLRKLVEDSLQKHMYDNALYFSNKLVSLSGTQDDYYLLAQTYFLTDQFQRAYHCLEHSPLHLIQTDKRSKLLAAKCKAKLKCWEECLEILQGGSAASGKEGRVVGEEVSLEAACCLLQGQAFEALENRKQALNCYSQALKEDIFCYEAFHTLIDKQMLTSNEEAALLEGLDFKGNEWLKQVYLHKIKKFNLEKLPEPTIIKEYNLHTNPDIITSKAESYYFRNQFEKAYALTKQILEDDPYDHNNTVVIHLSCLVELGKKSELFYIAHKLVEMQPNESVSWYAVGCYYYLIRKYEKARRYFSKSTTTTKDFGPGWLGFGHAFAIEGEHDQALAAYRSAHRLLSKSHIPPLYIGIELVRANNLPLARQFVKKSESGCPYDPLVYNELGVIDFKDGKYNDAIVNFEKALGLLSDVSVLATWEPIFFNLGHCYRKLRQYHNAIKYYKKALKLSSQNSTTYTALAFTHHLLNNTTIAIELYHKALALNPDDNFASRMLASALEEEAFFQTWIGEKITEPMDQT